jgi:hypothetical protein
MHYEGHGILGSYGEGKNGCWVRLFIELQNPNDPHPFRGADTGFESGQRVAVQIVSVANDGQPEK